MSCWEIMLSKGQEWDWLGDPFGRVQTLVLAVRAGAGLPDLPGDADRKNPIINFRVLRRAELRRVLRRSCSSPSPCCTARASRCRGCSSRCSATTPSRSGLVMSPSGVSSLAAMVVVGVLMGRGADARWLVAVGLVVMAAADYWMAQMNLADQPLAGDLAADAADPRPGAALRPDQRGRLQVHPRAPARGGGRAVLSLLRTEGGSVGTSMAQTIQERREQFHLSRLGENLSPLNPHVDELHGPGPAVLLPADRRRGRVAADGRAGAGQPSPAAGRVAGLLRRLLGRAASWRRRSSFWCC